MFKGLRIRIYRHTMGDTTNNGITANLDSVTMVSEEWAIDPIFTANEDETLKLIMRNVCGNSFPILVPLDYGQGKHYMFGGNFGFTSDSRFPFNHPVKIFDRHEG